MSKPDEEFYTRKAVDILFGLAVFGILMIWIGYEGSQPDHIDPAYKVNVEISQ